MFNIKWGLGLTDEVDTENLQEAQQQADNDAAYSQRDIVIEDEDGEEVSRRTWCGVKYDAERDECEDPICFGDFGFYGDWS